MSEIYNKYYKLSHMVGSFIKQYPIHAILLASILAIIGCVFPLLVPALGYYSITAMWSVIQAAPAPVWPGILDWWPVVMWLITFVASMVLSYRLMLIRPSFPDGVELSREMAPELYALIHDMKIVRWQMPIHRVIVTEQFHLDIIKTRISIIPFWSRNTLVIGMPLIQVLPPQVFKALLARKLCQHSLLRNPFLHVLHQLNSAWWQYYETFSAHPAADMKLYAVLAGSFALLYHRVVEPVARLDGMSADRYTLKVINDEDAVISIQYLFVAGMFVEKIFWPRLRTLAREQRKYDLTPFAALGRVRNKYLQKLSINAWVQKEMSTGLSPRWGVASMPERLNTLGHDNVLPLVVDEQSAAEYYFSDCLDPLIKKIDERWIDRTVDKWKEADEQLREEQALMSEIEDKLRTFDYDLDDISDYIIWAIEIRKLSALLPLAKMFFLMRIGSSRKMSVIS